MPLFDLPFKLVPLQRQELQAVVLPYMSGEKSETLTFNEGVVGVLGDLDHLSLLCPVNLALQGANDAGELRLHLVVKGQESVHRGVRDGLEEGGGGKLVVGTPVGAGGGISWESSL